MKAKIKLLYLSVFFSLLFNAHASPTTCSPQEQEFINIVRQSCNPNHPVIQGGDKSYANCFVEALESKQEMCNGYMVFMIAHTLTFAHEFERAVPWWKKYLSNESKLSQSDLSREQAQEGLLRCNINIEIASIDEQYDDVTQGLDKLALLYNIYKTNLEKLKIMFGLLDKEIEKKMANIIEALMQDYQNNQSMDSLNQLEAILKTYGDQINEWGYFNDKRSSNIETMIKQAKTSAAKESQISEPKMSSNERMADEEVVIVPNQSEEAPEEENYEDYYADDEYHDDDYDVDEFER